MQAQPNAKVLLSHSAWLRKLAWDLVGDAQRAEDVVQETWVAALERPPRFADDGPRLRAWLGQVTRNFARMSRRADARREVRERSSARPEAQPSLHDSVERVALQREVVSAVMSLRSPDREIVILRYFENRKPANIAQELGLTSSAVRTRLSRSLDVLRTRLDDANDGRRERWAPALAAWATVESSAAGAVLGGGLAKPIWTLVGVGVLASIGWIGWRAASPPAAGVRSEYGPTGASASAPTSSSSTPSSPTAADITAPARDARRAESADTDATTTAPPELPVLVRGRCLDRTGAPLAGVRVEARRGIPEHQVRSTADGTFELALSWPPTTGWAEGRQRVYIDFGGDALATCFAELFITKPGEQFLPDVVLDPGGNIVGRLVDENGNALEGVRIDAVKPVPASGPAREHAEVRGGFVLGKSTCRSSKDGSFELEGVPATTVSISSWKTGSPTGAGPLYLRAVSEPIAVPPGGTADVGTLVARPAGPARLIRGRVLDPFGRPAPAADVDVHRIGKRGTVGGYGWSRPEHNPEGRFQVLVERGFEYAVSATGPGWNELRIEGVAPGDPELVLEFTERAQCDVRVTDATGTPIDEFTVFAVRDDGPNQHLMKGSVQEGRARVSLTSKPGKLRVLAPGYLPAELGPISPDAPPIELHFQLERPGGVSGRVLGEGRPLAGVHVHAHSTDPTDDPRQVHFSTLGERRPEGTTTDATGEFFLPLSEGGTFTLHGEHPEFARTQLGTVSVTDRQRIEIDDVALVRGGQVTGRLLTPPEVRSAGWNVGATSGDGHAMAAVVDHEGRFVLEHLAPGEWTVARFERYSRPVANFPEDRLPLETEPRATVDVVDGETVSATLDLRHLRVLTLRGYARLDGAAPSGATVTLADRTSVAGITLDERGDFIARLPAAGKYSIRIHQAPRPGLRIDWGGEVEVREFGAEWTTDLACGTFEVTGLGALGPGAALDLEWRGDAGLRWRAHAEELAGDVLRLDQVPAGELKCYLRDAGSQRELVRELTLRVGELVELNL